MIRAVTDIIRRLRLDFPDYHIDFAFDNGFQDRPVMSTAVYVTAKEIRSHELDFVIYVYSPIPDGGDVCMNRACDVYNSLFGSGLEMRDTAVGGIQYDSNSQGYVVKINGTVDDNTLEFDEPTPEPEPEPEEELIYCNFTCTYHGEEYHYRVQAKRYKVLCEMNNYPVTAIFESEPIDVLEEGQSYKIVLEGYDRDRIQLLTWLRDFTLSFDNGRFVFDRCMIVKYERDNSGAYFVTVESKACTII